MTMPIRSLWVPGRAVAQGSKVAMTRPNGTIAVVESRGNREALAAFRADIREEWHRKKGVGWEGKGGIGVLIVVTKPRPKSHFTSKGGLVKGAPMRPVTKPDVDKLARAVLDALTGHAFRDDSQVVDLHVVKAYSDTPEAAGTLINVFDLEADVLAPAGPTP